MILHIILHKPAQRKMLSFKVPPRFELRLQESESYVITNYTMGPRMPAWEACPTMYLPMCASVAQSEEGSNYLQILA